MLQKEYGPRTLRLSTSLNIPRVGRMLTIIETLKSTGLQNELKIGNNTRAWLKELSSHFLTRKSKKLLTKDRAYENS